MKSYYNLLVTLSPDMQEKERIHAELAKACMLINDQPLLKKGLLSPFVNLKKKRIIVQKVFSQMIEKKGLSFLLLLVIHNRLLLLPQILRQFSHHIEENKGKIAIAVTTAETLTYENQRSLQEKLEEVYKKKIELLTQVDKSILGGFILLFPNHKLLDYSLKSRLMHLKLQLTKSHSHAP